MLEGKFVNLRVREKEDTPLLTEWFNSPEVNGDYDFPLQSSRTEIEKRFEKAFSEPSPFEMRTFIIEKKARVGLDLELLVA